MGKVTGFLEIDRQERSYDKPQERLENYREFVPSAFAYGDVSKQSGALHGLRHSLLSPGLPRQ